MVTAQFGGAATGTITFESGTVVLGTIPLSSGQATLSTTFAGAGSQSITAAYSGDANYTSSTSPALNQVVSQATTTTSVASSLNPSVAGQSVTLSATVTAQFGGTPTGTVTIKSGAVVLGTVSLSGGQASLNTAFAGTGSQSVTAAYSGDVNYIASTSNALSQVVNQATTTTSLVPSPNPSSVGQSVAINATVIPQYAGTPSGTVTFLQNGSAVGIVTLSGGQATLNKVFNSAGTKSLTAIYSGDPNFTTSSGTATQTVQ